LPAPVCETGVADASSLMGRWDEEIRPLSTRPDAGDDDGLNALIASSFVWTVGWVALFYALSASQPWWCRSQSTKPHENDRYWCARNLLGVLHSVLIAAICVPASFAFLTGPHSLQFAASQNLEWCSVDPSDPNYAWRWTGQAVAFSGLAFTTFTFADIFISLFHGLATWDYIVHHIAFVIAGSIIRGHCILPFNAAVLMAMEASTPFLNFVVFYRHRGTAYQTRLLVSGVVFFVSFVFFRIGLNGYGTVLLWIAQSRDSAIPHRVPAWEAWFLLVAVTAGAGVQLFWLKSVTASFWSRVKVLFQNGTGNVSMEEKEGEGAGQGERERALLASG